MSLQKRTGTVFGCFVVPFEGCGEGSHNHLAESKKYTVRGFHCILVIGTQNQSHLFLSCFFWSIEVKKAKTHMSFFLEAMYDLGCEFDSSS